MLSPFIIQLSVYFSLLFLPYFPLSSLLHSSSTIFTCQNDHPSRLCVSFCVCVRTFVSVQGKISVWPMVRGKDCLYYRLLLRHRKMKNSKSELVFSVCVCIRLHALSCPCTGLLASLLASMLFENLILSLCLSLRPICCLRATTVVKSSRQTS